MLAPRFAKGGVVNVQNKMQRGYRFTLAAGVGRLPRDFRPHLSPKEMLELGVFEGHYCTDCMGEYPASWFSRAKLSPAAPDVELNYFGVKSRLPLSEWRRRGWIDTRDPRGWFEWYMRYYLGRRIPGYDEHQMARWRAFKRHLAQVEKNCERGDLGCRPKQRQALLQWAYDPFV